MALEWIDPASLEDALADPRLRMDVFSYLAEQVFQRQTEPVQAFLLRTCCLEHVSVELGRARHRLGLGRAPSALPRRNQVFTFDAGRRGTYRYHKLLRDYLRQRFVQDEGERAFRALQLDTAAALEAYGDRPSAVELLLGATSSISRSTSSPGAARLNSSVARLSNFDYGSVRLAPAASRAVRGHWWLGAS